VEKAAPRAKQSDSRRAAAPAKDPKPASAAVARREEQDEPRSRQPEASDDGWNGPLPSFLSVTLT
jgi:hypothetical protein